MPNRLEYRTNNAYDTVVLVDAESGLVLSDWAVTRQVMEDYCDCSQDAGDWDDRGGDEHRPDDYGSLVATRVGYTLAADDETEWARRVEFHCH